MSLNNNFAQLQQEKVIEIEQLLRKYLPVQSGYQKIITEAMEYSLMAGGKRLRPMMMQEVFRLFGGTMKAIEPSFVLRTALRLEKHFRCWGKKPAFME